MGGHAHLVDFVHLQLEVGVDPVVGEDAAAGQEFAVLVERGPALPKNTGYKAYYCNYDYRGGWGAYQTYNLIVVAESAEKALEVCIGWGSFGETKEKNLWTIVEIQLNKPHTIYVSESSS